MSDADNIEGVPAGNEVVDKASRRARRLALNRTRSTEWRAEKRRQKPATRAAVLETIALCLLDVADVPPELQGARKRMAGAVVGQAVLTLQALGHPDVDGSVKEAIAHLKGRLTTETWHRLSAQPSGSTPRRHPRYSISTAAVSRRSNRGCDTCFGNRMRGVTTTHSIRELPRCGASSCIRPTYAAPGDPHVHP